MTQSSPLKSHAWLWTGLGFEKTAGLPVTDRGIRYGMSVFESFPVWDGATVFMEKHLARLRDGCAVAGFAVPDGALDACETVLKKAGDGFGRIYVTAGDGTVTSDFDACRVLVFVEAREPIPARIYHRGYDLGIHRAGYVPVFGGIKTGNYWANLRAFREGVAARHNETLLFTPEGHLVSACMANVFVVSGEHVKTPELGTGARPGVLREWVMERVETEEAALTRADVESAEEIFLTSSWLGIMPAASIDGRALTRKTVSARLIKSYRKEVERK